VVNDGLFAGSRGALLALDGVIRTIPDAPAWINQHSNNWWRNQFIFSLALAGAIRLRDRTRSIGRRYRNAFRDCIEERSVGSLEGMAAALQSGERYEGALLDSIHSEEQVWAEFQFAAQLVCPCGLILVHDPRYSLGTVEQAIIRVEAAGYNVSRLWAAESGVAEDDHLDLALIVNARRIGAEGKP
jgi:hypothetical protein